MKNLEATVQLSPKDVAIHLAIEGEFTMEVLAELASCNHYQDTAIIKCIAEANNWSTFHERVPMFLEQLAAAIRRST